MSPIFSTKICLISSELFQWCFLQIAIFSFKAWGGGEGEEKIPEGEEKISQKHTSQSTGLLCTESTAKSGSNKSNYECSMLLNNYFYHIFYTLQLKPRPLQTVINMTAAAKSLCSKETDNRGREKITQTQIDEGHDLKKNIYDFYK